MFFRRRSSFFWCCPFTIRPRLCRPQAWRRHGQMAGENVAQSHATHRLDRRRPYYGGGLRLGKAVPVNARKFKNPKGGMAVVALAGPVANLIAAFVSLLLCNFIIFPRPLGRRNRLAGRACHTHVFALSLFVHGSNQRLPRRL